MLLWCWKWFKVQTRHSLFGREMVSLQQHFNGFQAWEIKGIWSSIYKEGDGVVWWKFWRWFLRNGWSPKNAKNQTLLAKCCPLLACNSFSLPFVLQLALFWWDHGGPNMSWGGFISLLIWQKLVFGHSLGLLTCALVALKLACKYVTQCYIICLGSNWS